MWEDMLYEGCMRLLRRISYSELRVVFKFMIAGILDGQFDHTSKFLAYWRNWYHDFGPREL